MQKAEQEQARQKTSLETEQADHQNELQKFFRDTITQVCFPSYISEVAQLESKM